MEQTYGYKSPLGGILLTSDGTALTGLRFDDVAETPDGTVPEAFGETVRWLDLYFSGRDPGFFPRFEVRASAFTREVCSVLLTVPYGKTVAYGEIAARIAEKRGIPRMSAQAVGGACGRNPVALIVPCHRAVGAGGKLTGYAGGLERKRRLLETEGALPAGRSAGTRIRKEEGR